MDTLRRYISVFALTFSALAVLGFATAPAQATSDKINVVVTTGMIADAVTEVGGDLVEVKALMGPGVDPHAYRQTRTDIVALTRADLVLWHGLYLEAQMEELLLELGQIRNVVAVGETVPQDLLIAHADYDGRYDPHVWMVPDLWQHVVLGVASSLSEIAPEHTEVFSDNADAHLSDIDQLNEYALRATETVPQQARVLLTAHDAFGYFGQAYGFEVVGVQGISTESEAGLDRIGMLVGMLVSRDIRAVFVESSVSDRNMRALIEGAAAQGHGVQIGGELFSDAMGELGTYEGTYLGMIDHNITTIVDALGGDVPTRGLNGRLAAGS